MAFRGRTKMARTRIHRSVVTRWRSVMLERTEPGRAHSGSGYRQDPTGTLPGVPQRSPEPCRHRSAAPSPRRTDPGARRQAVCDIARNLAVTRDTLNRIPVAQTSCSTSPEGRRREAGAFDKRPQLGPGKAGVDPAAEAAIGAGNYVLTADDRRVAQDAVGDELRVLDKVGSVADDARHQHFCGPAALP